VCWKPRSSCWSFDLHQEEFLSAPIHSPPPLVRRIGPSPVLEQKKARAEQAVKGSQAQIESNKEMLAKLLSALELKIARKVVLETELRNL
jgi:hypothetical protein